MGTLDDVRPANPYRVTYFKSHGLREKAPGVFDMIYPHGAQLRVKRRLKKNPRVSGSADTGRVKKRPFADGRNRLLIVERCVIGIAMQSGETANVSGDVVMSNLRAQVSSLIDRLGMVPAACALGVSRESLMRVAVGVPVRAGTLALIRESLGRVELQTAEGAP